ncbi:MAG: histidinol phosphate aminotransferase [Rhodospirillaceae bacterium]|nr:histidinol phosphate aminotransferase [Rhodospirillaceae bacterium]|tara:strand:+ start:104 stop:1201 length:1098 start_codon:yes stop_codon:yes gene_type:complete
MVVEPAKLGVRDIGAYMIDEDPGDYPEPRIRLNSNESVFGASPLAIEAARDAAGRMERYLEGADAILAPAIGDFFDLDEARITVGNGSDDLLARLARIYLGPGTEMLRSENGYAKAPNYAVANDASVRSVPDQGFITSVDALLEAISWRTKMVYLANPENPAGTHVGDAEIRRLHKEMPSDALLVLDCAYEEYVDSPDHDGITDLVESADNIVISRTFSKIFGMAGARVGWMYAPLDIVENLRKVSTTFPVADASVAAALAALKDRGHFDHVFEATVNGRRWLTERLTGLGLDVIPSQANFVLVGFPNPERSAPDADRHLRQKGIAVRRFPSVSFQDYLRITIGRMDELEAVANALEEFLQSNER